MNIEQIYTGCLSHAAYLVKSDGEAAIFDPLRDVDSYIVKADQANAQIKYIFETHFHADFVSGHLELQKKTGAEIVFGPTAKPSYDALIGEDGQIFRIGKCSVQLIHTPGHTMESSTYLIIDEENKAQALITGDTLFIGDVGRPDLAQHVNSDLTQDKLARLLYHSLRNKIMPLEDHLIVYPNHGAGSACGKKMSKENTDTLGNQKKTNYALRSDMTEDEFVNELLSGLADPPGYFPKNVLLNINGYPQLDEVLTKGEQPLQISDLEMMMEDDGILILDTREASEFAKGFVPGSINIGLDGSFAGWVGEIITDIQQRIVLITEKGREQEAVIRLSRVGYDNAVGFLEGGFDAWKESGRPIQTVERISAADFAASVNEDILVIDVRKNSEFASEHVAQAINIPLHSIFNHFDDFPQGKNFIIHCAGGYRSMIAASILKKNGIHHFKEIQGGFSEIKKTDVPRTAFIAPVSYL